MIIANGCASNYGSESIQWPGGGDGSLGSSGLKSASLSGSLVEPDSDVGLPVLSKVDVGDHVVVLYHLSQN